ncbi:MAG: hypothetical protein LBH20_10055 [Treponema sp.]|jgi:hypothetical protein|nr:hypothetical protein [Treponema sp.]
MSFARSLPVVVSVFISAGLAALGTLIPTAEVGGAYAALVCSEAVPDREIRGRLENQGFTGLVSESGQWVLLDCFGSIEQIPLDEYHSRILPFDPRNDGYADKLRSLFVQDDKRFIYIPHKAGIEKKLASLLGDIPYSFEYATRAGQKRPLFVFFTLFFLAALALITVRPLRWALRPHAVSLIPCLPALAPLAIGGAAGFALASLLAGCAVLVAGPCLERFIMPQRRGLPPVLCWLLPFFLLICYVILAFFSGTLHTSGLPSFFTLLVLLFFGGILAFSLWSNSVSGARVLDGLFIKRRYFEHQRFFPVLILKPRSFSFAFSWAMLPFAAASLVLACAGIIFSLVSPAVFPGFPSASAVTEADYRAHYRFQSIFSQMSLHRTGAADGMGLYELAPDGLPGQIFGGGLSAENRHEKDAPPDDIPPFPLGSLMGHLNSFSRGGTAVPELLSVLLPLFFILPILFQGRNAGRRVVD